MVDDSHATGFFGPTGPRHARALRGRRARRHHHLDARQGPRRRQRRLHGRPARDRRAAAPAVAALPLLEHACRRPLVGASLACLDLLSRTHRAPRPARGQHPLVPRGDDRGRLPRSAPASTRSSRSCSATRASRSGWRPTCSTRASTSSASRSRSCPRGQARIRVQICAAHEPEHLERAVAAFTKVGRVHGVV